MRVFGFFVFGVGFLMSLVHTWRSRPESALPVTSIAVQGVGLRSNATALSKQTRLIHASAQMPGATVRLRQTTKRFQPLLPSRGGVDRLRAYTAYIVTATRDCRHRLSHDRAERISRSLLLSADREGLDPRLFTAMIQRESDFNPDETSSCGAKGLGQLTHWDDGGVDCYNIEANLTQSAKNLKGHLKEFGSPELALAAYNAGEEAVRRHHGIPPYAETRAHVRVVMNIYRRVSRPVLSK